MPYKNKEKRKRYVKQWYADNLEKVLKQGKQYRKDNPEKVRMSKIKSNYGLSHECWLEIWRIQGGKCAICDKTFKSPSDACVDHDHKTGKVRGLLCNKCNMAIGLFKDNKELLSNAIKYLSL